MGIIQFLKSKTFLKQLIIAFVGLFLLIFAVKYWLNVTTNHDQKIQVPNLQKLPFAEAKQKLTELNLDFKVMDSASYNPSYPNKSVIEQNPEAGDFVKEKRKIYLVLNPSKYRDIEIPDINGRTKRQATTELKSIGFNVGTKFTYVPDIGRNVVRGLKFNNEKIKAGDKLPKNSTIELILGDGSRN
jgi:beta-lactam-binding protein with PASTA domain